MKIEQATISRIKSLVDPELVLDSLGFDVIRRGSKELRGPCKIHGGDNPTGFRFNLDTRTWSCFTRHCEGENERDLVGLVQKTTGKSFIDSVRHLADLCGIDLNNQEQVGEVFAKAVFDAAIKKEIRTASFLAKRATDVEPFPEEALQHMISNRTSYFSDRGFPDYVLDFYEIGGWTDTKGVLRATIPIRDENGNLLTVSARRTDCDEDPKYLLLRDIKKGNTLYNLHVAKEYVGEPPERTLIIVEGFVDVWNMAMKEIYNVVAIMGTSVTLNQALLVSKYAENAIILLDADKAGRQGAPKVEELLKRASVDTKIVSLPDGKDPKELTKEEIDFYIGG